MIYDINEKDIGKKVIYGIFNEDIPKQYGVIVSFDDDYVYCTFGKSTKIISCKYEDLDFDIQDDEY